MSSIYIDPMVDFAFKKLFGSEPNKDLLIAFLNEVAEVPVAFVSKIRASLKAAK